MTQPAPVTETTAATPPTGDGEGGTFEENYARLQEEIRRESAREAPAQAPATTTTPAAPAAATPDQAAADRRARLAELAAKTRRTVDEHARRQGETKLAEQLEAARKRATELEAQITGRIDRSVLKDPLAALALLEEEGVPADKVAEALRTHLADPSKAAAFAARQAAKQSIDPEVKALRDKLDATEALVRELAEERKAQQQRAQEEHYKRQFFDFVGSQKDGAPLSARLLEADPEDFLSVAEIAGQRIPHGAGPQALLDQIEELLSTDGRALAERLARLHGLLPATTSNASTPPTSAAAKATTTVTNQIAQERASVVTDADPLEGLSFDERVEWLKRHA